jgi:hypothetical protein
MSNVHLQIFKCQASNVKCTAGYGGIFTSVVPPRYQYEKDVRMPRASAVFADEVDDVGDRRRKKGKESGVHNCMKIRKNCVSISSCSNLT